MVRAVPLADDFSRFVASLPPDWSTFDFDLRIFDEQRYIEAATILVQVNAQPYSRYDWHWHILVAREFGHAAAAETVPGTLAVLDGEGIEGELAGARSARRTGRGDAGLGPAGVGAAGVSPPPRAVTTGWLASRCSAPT